VVEQVTPELGVKLAVASLFEQIDIVLGQQSDRLPEGDEKVGR
jgi:hypothetical protein